MLHDRWLVKKHGENVWLHVIVNSNLYCPLTRSSVQAHLGHTSRLQGLVEEKGRLGVRRLPDA